MLEPFPHHRTDSQTWYVVTPEDVYHSPNLDFLVSHAAKIQGYIVRVFTILNENGNFWDLSMEPYWKDSKNSRGPFPSPQRALEDAQYWLFPPKSPSALPDRRAAVEHTWRKREPPKEG